MPAAVAAAPKVVRAGRVPAVDRKYYEDKIEIVDKEIKDLMAKTQALTKTISAKSTGKEEFYAQKDAKKAEIDAVQAKLNELEKRRNAIQEQIKKIQQDDKDSRTEVQKMQKTIGYQSEEHIDREIADIEYQMHTESLTLKREKELILKISQLKQVKPQLNKLSKMKDGQTGVAGGDSVGALKLQLAEIQKDIAALRDEKQKHSAALGKILDARKKSMVGVTQYFDERDQISATIKTKLAEIKALKDERSEKIRAFNAQMATQKELWADRDKVIKAAKDAEREVRKRESDLNQDNVAPFEKELDLIENMVKYCEKLAGKNSASSTSVAAPSVASLEGTNVLVSKKDREAVYFSAPTTKKAAAKTVSAPTETKAITHSLETLGLFSDVKVSPPTSVKDIPATIEALHKKTADFKAKQVKETADRKSKRVEREAALLAAVAALEVAAEEAKKYNFGKDETE